MKKKSHLLTIAEPVECIIISRQNRFVVSVEVNGENYRASTNNTGRLEQFIITGRKAFCISHSKSMKTDFRLFAIEEGQQAAIIDTRLQMQAFEIALEKLLIPWLNGYRMVKRDAQLGQSRIDYLLKNNSQKLYLEAKSAVLRDGHYAMYPDCPTARGRKHIAELTGLIRSGGQATILFLAALPNVSAFKPSWEGDPQLCQLLLVADKAGLELRSLGLTYDPKDAGIYLYNPDLPIEL